LQTLGVIPDQQSKQSYLVQYIKNNYIGGKGATMAGAYASMLAELSAHGAKAAFGTSATSLNILDFSLDYDNIAAFDKALGLYLLAKTAIALGFTGSPYTKTLASWTATQISAFVADMTGAGA